MSRISFLLGQDNEVRKKKEKCVPAAAKSPERRGVKNSHEEDGKFTAQHACI